MQAKASALRTVEVMKRIPLLVLALTAAATLSACGSSEAPVSNPSPVVASPPVTVPGIGNGSSELDPGSGALPGTPPTGTTPDPSVTKTVPGDDEAARTQKAGDAVVGMSEASASMKLEAGGFIVRIVARDGEYFPVTADYSVNRVDLEINGGKVTAVSVG